MQRRVPSRPAGWITGGVRIGRARTCLRIVPAGPRNRRDEGSARVLADPIVVSAPMCGCCARATAGSRSRSPDRSRGPARGPERLPSLHAVGDTLHHGLQAFSDELISRTQGPRAVPRTSARWWTKVHVSFQRAGRSTGRLKAVAGPQEARAGAPRRCRTDPFPRREARSPARGRRAT